MRAAPLNSCKEVLPRVVQHKEPHRLSQWERGALAGRHGGCCASARLLLSGGAVWSVRGQHPRTLPRRFFRFQVEWSRAAMAVTAGAVSWPGKSRGRGRISELQKRTNGMEEMPRGLAYADVPQPGQGDEGKHSTVNSTCNRGVEGRDVQSAHTVSPACAILRIGDQHTNTVMRDAAFGSWRCDCGSPGGRVWSRCDVTTVPPVEKRAVQLPFSRR
jgi:hypothetical protein